MTDDAHIQTLRRELDALLQECDYAAHRAKDPVSLVWEYEDPEDQSLIGLLASGLAYGRVALVRDAGRRAATPLGSRPVVSLMNLSDDELQGMYQGFVYRMTRGEDIVDLLCGVRAIYLDGGSIEQVYAQGGETHNERVIHLVETIRRGRLRPNLERGFRYLLPSPADKGACKRLHLYLRWMGRGPDGVDLGTWKQLDPADLLMPLDTHTARICRYLGLSQRKTVDAKMVHEVTQGLAQLDPVDPLKYDFPICHLGISGGCIHTWSEDHCPSCPLNQVCVLAADSRASG